MDPNVIWTRNGKVRGKVVELRNCKDGKPVHVYRNIPFAKPPTGVLRFMPPQPAEAWDGVIDGAALGSRPMFEFAGKEMFDKAFPLPLPKGDIGMSEDCLYLSIYSTDPHAGKKPAGGFYMGSEVDYDLSAVAGLNDVVVVVPNYRVGIFGFFSLGRYSPCTGNAGILDQQMALRWVNDNIRVFGGDNRNVTIFGESAGGVSVHLNMVSPPAKGLFHKAISQSGQISMPTMFNSEKKNKRALDLTLKHFGIKACEPLKILEALQALPAEKLLTVTNRLEENKAQFLSMVDGSTFVKPPMESLKNGEFLKIPYVAGCNRTEGNGLCVMFYASGNPEEFTEELAKAASPLQISDEGWSEMNKHYRTSERGAGQFVQLLSNIVQDGLVSVPTIHDAKVHAEGGAPVYVYIGDFRLKLHHDEAYGNAYKKPETCVCDHGDDVFMTLGLPFSPNDQPMEVKYSKEEEALSRKWMTYLTNFAKTGDPNKGSMVEKQWPEYKSGEILVLNHEITTMKNYKEDEIEFWMKIMPPYYF